MKNLLPYFAGLCGIAVCCFLVSAKGIKSNPEPVGFVADSGYITPGNVHQLLKITQADTLFTFYTDAPATDTLGKYYKMANGNYIASVAVIGPEGYILCEATPDGTVLKQEKYIFNNFECCWKSKDDCLRKYGNYYTFLTCSTGTDYCGGYLYIFKEVTSQQTAPGIDKSEFYRRWKAGKDTYHDINGEVKVTGDTVTMHYTHEVYKERKNGKRKVKLQKRLSACYTQQDGKWVIADSVKVKAFLSGN